MDQSPSPQEVPSSASSMEKERKRGAIKVVILQPTERRFSDSLVFAITDTANTPQMPGSSLLRIPKSPNIYKISENGHISVQEP